MNYDNMNSVPVNYDSEVVCCPDRTIKDNLAELTRLLHVIEDKMNILRQTMWAKNESAFVKDIEVIDLDSNVVHNMHVAKRINDLLEDTLRRFG